MTLRTLRSIVAAGMLLAGASHAATLEQLADEADLVAIAIVEQVDYEMTRSFPSSGSAYLRILIPYKGIQSGEWIEVREKGLADNACYYPEPDPFSFEGARFLVMLRKDPKEKGVYHGIKPTCMVPVLVTAGNEYAVRYPVLGLDLPADAVEQMQFADPAAVVDATDFTRAEVTELVETYQAEPVETGPYEPNTQLYAYTRGIPLSHIRQLMGLTVVREPTGVPEVEEDPPAEPAAEPDEG